MKIILLISILILTSSCASLFQERTFVQQMDRQDNEMWTPHEDFYVVPGDIKDGYRSKEQIAARTPGGNKVFTLEDNLEHELLMKEKILTMEQYAGYSEIKTDLDSTSEKIYFLNLTVNEREEYLSSKQIGKYAIKSRPSRKGRRVSRAPSSMPISNAFSYGRSIYQGMGKGEVRDSWGRPSRVEVAGDPGNQNERWTFHENGKVKRVFFESGVVQGWALE